MLVNAFVNAMAIVVYPNVGVMEIRHAVPLPNDAKSEKRINDDMSYWLWGHNSRE